MNFQEKSNETKQALLRSRNTYINEEYSNLIAKGNKTDDVLLALSMKIGLSTRYIWEAIINRK